MVVHCCDHAPQNVIDIGVITPSAAIPEDRNWGSCEHHAGEFMNGEIGPLAWSIHGEESQGQKTNPEEVSVYMPHQFAADLCSSIRADRKEYMVGFRPGHALVDPVYTAARSENEMFDS